jgi:hypothetical protein
MKSQTVLLSTIAISLFLVSSMSFLPAGSASSAPNPGSSTTMTFQGYSLVAPSASTNTKLPTYHVKISFSPDSLSIAQAPGSDCGKYPKCGSATTTITLKNKGGATFTTNGACSMVVSPGLNGKSSERIGCSFPPNVSTASHKSSAFIYTISIYNWPDGTYKVKLNVDGTVGATTYKSTSGYFTLIVTG